MSDPCCHDAECAPAAKPSDRAEIWLLGGAGLAIGLAAAAQALGYPVVAIAASLMAVAATIPTPARRAWQSLGQRVLDINVLMIIAVAGAMALGDWIEAAVVVWLFGVAQWLERRSMERARRAIRALMIVAPTLALVRRGRDERTVPVSEVVIGDVVIVRPGERVPLDGRVVAGESALDESAVTGESWPADKTPGDEVFAGTINGTGALEVEVDRPASESTLAHVIRFVEQAQRRKASVQTFVERFARRYTPAVVALAVGLAIVPPLVGAMGGATQPFAVWVYRALALLVVACPCALVISTPVSFVSALTTAARHGVLIKGGAHLERLGGIRCVAFDKTGTLTHGRVTVTDVVGVDGVSSHGVLSVAAALESRSEHPIGRAIVDRARLAGVEVAAGREFRALPGLGAEATVEAVPAIVGSHRLFEERQLCTPALHDRIDEVTERGATPVLVGHGGAPLGVIGLADEMRADGRAVIAELREQGIERVVLLTGDSNASAKAAQAHAGLDEAHAELLPADKVEHLARLRASYGPVAMVGDGVNDAPALAAADVGVAMGAAGSDVALEAADVALMSDDLGKLPFAMRLGRATRTNVRLNVSVALGLKLVFVGLAAFGLATLWLAVLADTGASLLVTANSLRLLRVK